ncbi:hypothetical protein N0V91_010506 [Didymella pomorum]|uniref:Uncharacterized protein n=1 Tax=Didymella pomorum TaxID=749634 RepID=A0A9W8Z731_9PLEO|nr:hypothetical protein N0V91_010506 [Didymella pomorum]
MSPTTHVLITGASRGIGKGLVAAYLNSFNTTVVAAVRNIASADSLRSLPKASGSRLVVININVASADSIKRGITSMELEHKIDSLDVVLANAGIAAVSPGLSEIDVGDIQPFLNINAYGQLELFKAVAPLLRRSSSGAPSKFMYIIVATDMAQIAFDSLKGKIDFDFAGQAVSVEQSCQNILEIVSAPLQRI